MPIKESWRSPSVILTILALILGAIYFGWDQIINLIRSNRPAVVNVMRPPPAPRVEPGSSDHYLPINEGSPTVLSVQNPNSTPAQIDEIVFHDLVLSETPKRVHLMTAGPPPIVVVFRRRDFDAQRNCFAQVLRDRPPLMSNGTTLEISIVNPNEVGKTYTGKVTVNFNGDQHTTAEQLTEVDVVAKPPKKE